MARKKRDTSGKIRVRVLGGVDFQIGSRRIGMNTEVLFGLGLYLTTRAGERIPREEILETFWSKGTDAQRRHALRQLLYRLRQKGLLLDEDGDYVRVDPKRVESDVRAALGGEWVEKASATDVEAAGRFAPVFSRRQAPAFLEWMDRLRDEVSAQHRKASLRQITVARREGRWADLERWAQQVLKHDPLNEEATLARAESAAMAGSKTIAIEILDNYLAEIGDISPDLGKPALSLRKRLAERRADWAVRGPKEVPLVGRTELMSRLTGLVEAAWRGEGSAVVLVGAPGIGKTRLAMETRAYAELKGMRTVVVRAEAGNAERPLATALTLVSRLLELPGARGSNPSAYTLLKRISDTSARDGRLQSVPQDHPVSELVQPIAEILDAVSVETRIVILVDDAHNIDLPSLPVLGAVAAHAKNRRILWLFTSRGNPQSARTRELVKASFTAQRVTPLDMKSTRQLVTSVLEAHRLHLPGLTVESIAKLSGGNPLFARELGAHRAHFGEDESLPETLRELMANRTGRMDEGPLRILRVIALLGSCANVSRVRTLSHETDSSFGSLIDSLESEGLVSLDEGRLRLHESWRLHILAELGKASRAVIALECAEHLLLAGNCTIDEKWQAAELLFEAGERLRSKELFQESGGEMLRRGLPNEAASILTRVLELASSNTERLSAIRHLSEAHHARGDLASVIAITAGLTDLAQRPGIDASALADITYSICHRADALAKSHLPLPHELAWLRNACTREELPTETRHFAAYTGIRRAIFAEDRSLARDFHELALALTARGGETVPGTLVRLVFEAEFGSPEGVLDANARVELLTATHGHGTLSCNALRFRAAAVRMAGFSDLSAELGRSAYDAAVKLRQFEVAANAAEMMTFLHLDNENLAAAADWLDNWRLQGTPEANLMRDQGLAHAEIRLELQRGDAESARRMMEARLGVVSADGVLSRRLGELLTYGLAAALSGRKRDARDIIEEVTPLIRPAEPEFLLDYPNEIFARTLRALGDTESAINHAVDYVARRSVLFNRPLAPFYRELGSAAEALS